MKELRDSEIKKLITEAFEVSLGDDFTESVMQKIKSEQVYSPKPTYEWWWNGLAISLSFIVLLAYFILNPELLVHTIQRFERLVSFLNIGLSSGSLSVIGAILLLFGIDFVAKNHFYRLNSFFML